MLGALGLVAILASFGIARTVWNRDVALTVYYAGQMIDGSRLYRDILEIDPPFVFWAGVPVVWAARIVGMAPIYLYQAAVALAAVFVLYLLWQELAWIPAPGRAWIIVAAAAAVALVPQFDFGQRDHLFIVLFLPYVGGAAARARDRVSRHPIACGVTAGMGLALKPHFILALIAAEGYVAFRQRRFRVDKASASAAVAVAVLWAAVLLFAPAWFSLASTVAPLYLSSQELAVLLWRPGTGLIFAAAVLAVLSPPAPAWRELRESMAVATLAGMAIGLSQQKSWPYHFLPATIPATILLALAGVDVLLRRVTPVRRFVGIGIAGLIGMGVVIVGGSRVTRWVRGEQVERAFYTRLSRDIRPGERVAFLTVGLHNAFPLIEYAGADWALPTPSLWWVEYLYGHGEQGFRSPAEMSNGERFLASAVADSNGGGSAGRHHCQCRSTGMEHVRRLRLRGLPFSI